MDTATLDPTMAKLIAPVGSALANRAVAKSMEQDEASAESRVSNAQDNVCYVQEAAVRYAVRVLQLEDEFDANRWQLDLDGVEIGDPDYDWSHRNLVVHTTIDGIPFAYRYSGQSFGDHLNLILPCQNAERCGNRAVGKDDILNLVDLGRMLRQGSERGLCGTCWQEAEDKVLEEEEGEPKGKRKITVWEGSPDFNLVMAVRGMVAHYQHDHAV